MVKTHLINWFIDELYVKVDDEYCSKNFLTSGDVDSFSFVQLIAEIEEHFSVSLLEDDLTDENLFTINGLSQIIERKLSC